MTDLEDSFLSDVTATSQDDLLARANNIPLPDINNINLNTEADKYLNIIQDSPTVPYTDKHHVNSGRKDNDNFLYKKSKASFKKKISFKEIINDVSTLDYSKNYISIAEIAKTYGYKRKNKKEHRSSTSKSGLVPNPFTVSADSGAQYFTKDDKVDDRVIKKIQIYYDDKNKFYEKDDQFYDSLSHAKYVSTLIHLKSIINEMIQTEIQYLLNLKILTDRFLPYILDNNNTTLKMLTYYSNLLLKNHKTYLEEILSFFAEIEILSFLQIDYKSFKKLNLEIVRQENWKSIEQEYYKMLKHFGHDNSSLNIDKNSKHKTVNDGSNLFFGYFLILDFMSLKTTDVVSTYLYENYIKVYYIMLRILKNKEKSLINSKVCESIIGLNNLMSIKQKNSKFKKSSSIEVFFDDSHSPRDVFNNTTFGSLLQTPINRIIKYKMFMSKVLTEYNVEDRCKINIAVNFNDLLRKLEKIDNFQLDYVYTIKQSRYKKKEYGSVKMLSNDTELHDPNEKYSNIVDKITYNYKDTVISSKQNEREPPLNLESFGAIIILQPCIIRYVTNIHHSFFGFKENGKSQRIKKPTGHGNMGVWQESKMVVLLFKSHLLILNPAKVNKQYSLTVAFSLPLAICEIVNNEEQTLFENSNKSVNIRAECNFLKYEIMITSWNNIEHDNFSTKLKNLMEYYNKPSSEAINSEASDPNYKLVYPHGNDYNLSKESLLNNRSLKFNDVSYMFKQFIYPKNIVVCDYKSEYFDNLKVCYNKKIFFIKNNYIVNKQKYTSIDKNWILVNKQQSIADSDNNSILDVDIEDRAFIEEFLDLSKLWYNEIDILRLKDFEVLETENRSNTRINSFFIKSRSRKRGSFRERLKKSASFMSKTLLPSPKSDSFTNKSGSHTTTSDRSLLYLPSADILGSARNLRSSILDNNETSSYWNNGMFSAVLQLTTGLENKKSVERNNTNKKFFLSDETILDDQIADCNLLIQKEECLEIEGTAANPDINLNEDKESNEENTDANLVNGIVKQGTRLIYKMFL